jgi:hypothetical protein
MLPNRAKKSQRFPPQTNELSDNAITPLLPYILKFHKTGRLVVPFRKLIQFSKAVLNGRNRTFIRILPLLRELLTVRVGCTVKGP